jgi:hypothetical protein
VRQQGTGRAFGFGGRGAFGALLGIGLSLVVGVAFVALFLRERSWAAFLAVLAVASVCLVVMRFRGITIGSLAESVGPRTWLRSVGVIVVGVALVASVMRVAGVVRADYDELVGPTYSLRLADVEPLARDYVSPAAVLAAARVIPVSASYTVVPSNEKLPYLFRFWLRPRPFTWLVTDAEWVIIYGVPAPPGLRYRKKVVLGPNIYALEAAT